MNGIGLDRGVILNVIDVVDVVIRTLLKHPVVNPILQTPHVRATSVRIISTYTVFYPFAQGKAKYKRHQCQKSRIIYCCFVAVAGS